MFNYNNIDNIQICMDVPFVDHPYLIGPRGRKCQHLMDRYKSLIHFPDSNRRQNGPKLNNVIINGSSKNAEELRFQLRSRTPIRLAIQLHVFPDAYNLCNRMESAIAERSLPIRLNCADDYKSAMLKTEWRNEDVLVAFCDEFFCSHINTLAYAFDSGIADVFTMALTILPVINPWNPEISHWLIEHIFDITGCRVFYPPKEKFADQPPSYFIKGGTAAGVLKAGKFMLGLTMFQVNFIVPNSVKLNLDKISDWQRELLVHTSIEPVFANNTNGCGADGSSEFLHNRAVLRSFEFCLNGVYFVRSMLLGFKKTVQSSYYNFMNDVKHMIPCTVFTNSQLYFPLYPIDDERSFDWEMDGEEFFQKFYGGPYSPTATKQSSAPNSSNVLKTVNTDLTSRLRALLNVNVTSSRRNSEAESDTEESGQQIDSNNNEVKSENVSCELEVARSSPLKSKDELLRSFVSPIAPNDPEGDVLFDSPKQELSSRASIADFAPQFHQSTPVNITSSSSSFTFINCGVSATSPANLDHEDDPELQAILRRTMPCLQVTQQQVKSMDHERVSRALMTADSLAKLTNPLHRPFLHSEYAVSYPAKVAPEEFQRQFKEFVKMRNCYFHIRNAGKGDKEHSDLLEMSGGSNGGQARKSASF